MSKIAFAIAACVVLAGVASGACSPEEATAVHVLEAQGWRDVHVVGSGYFVTAWWCSRDDTSWFQAMATSASGERLEVVVCCGQQVVFSSGCMVRVR